VLRARVLGRMEVEVDGTTVRPRPSLRPWALFGALAIEPGSVSRSELATRFWPEVYDTTARANLRSALWALRRELGEWLVADEDRIGLREGPDVWVDVRAFDRAVTAGDDGAALELDRGALLDGLDDDWALLARERHRGRVVAALERLAVRAEAAGRIDEAIALTERQVTHDPLAEDVCRRLIARLASAGNRAAAIRAYRAHSRRLHHQLGIAPSAATRVLVDRLGGDPVDHA
jgi:DNA-binding SARP family transcriptional activator